MSLAFLCFSLNELGCFKPLRQEALMHKGTLVVSQQNLSVNVLCFMYNVHLCSFCV